MPGGRVRRRLTLIRGENDFTADVVMADGRPAGERGRELLPNPRLERVA